jgi:hypothetical protein
VKVQHTVQPGTKSGEPWASPASVRLATISCILVENKEVTLLVTPDAERARGLFARIWPPRCAHRTQRPARNTRTHNPDSHSTGDENTDAFENKRWLLLFFCYLQRAQSAKQSHWKCPVTAPGPSHAWALRDYFYNITPVRPRWGNSSVQTFVR